MGFATGRQTQSQIAQATALMDAAVNLIAWDLPKSGIQLLRQYDADAPSASSPAASSRSS